MSESDVSKTDVVLRPESKSSTAPIHCGGGGASGARAATTGWTGWTCCCEATPTTGAGEAFALAARARSRMLGVAEPACGGRT